MTAQRLSDLDPRHRRVAVLGAVLRIALTWVVLVAVYYALPEGRFGSSGAIVRLAVGVLLVFGVFAWQTHRIVHAELPALRAVVSMAVLIPLFLLVFSALYLSLSKTSPATFNENLDHSSALYFTITVFSTVGFGDIVPTTDTARIIVSAQMLLDLVIIGVVVRILIAAAKSGLQRARPGLAGQGLTRVASALPAYPPTRRRPVRSGPFLASLARDSPVTGGRPGWSVHGLREAVHPDRVGTRDAMGYEMGTTAKEGSCREVGIQAILRPATNPGRHRPRDLLVR